MTKSDRIGPTPELQKKGGIEQVESPDKGDRRIVTRRRQTLFDNLHAQKVISDTQYAHGLWVESLYFRTGFRGAKNATLAERVDGGGNQQDYSNAQIDAQDRWIALGDDLGPDYRRTLNRCVCGGEAALRTLTDLVRLLDLDSIGEKRARKTAKLHVQHLLDMIGESPHRDDVIDA